MNVQNLLQQRAQHITKDGIPECQRPTIPGIMSQRACTYYGARWVLAPIKNSLHLVHAPADCAFYGQNVRRKNYMILSTDLIEKDIIFGASRKLEESIVEADKIFDSYDLIFVYATCTASQIGEDIEWSIKRVKDRVNKILIPVVVPGFSGYSQADGHHIAQRSIANYILKNFKKTGEIENSVNIIGEYNVAGESQVIKRLLEKMGINVICTYTGDCSLSLMEKSVNAKLNLLLCKSSGLLLAQFMKERFSIPYMEVSFYGIENTIASIKKIAKFFGKEKATEIIAEEEFSKIKHKIQFFKSKLQSKKALVLLGGSRIGFMTNAFKEAGLSILVCGSQFGCSNDYQTARCVLPDSILVDDFNCAEVEEIILRFSPDLFIGGTREWYLSHKFGVPFLVLPQETKPYACFEGFLHLLVDIYKEVFAPVWRLI
ncbi:nitrogenase component 1 [Caldicellulosiruptor morganii]|uniref:Nitrogenase n=1 Tax=Caldicellulosiruptor morganii TaxID=1387555 RepID=A0ABY7BRK9_9FIRM|nr:nitrogenase component 1 [Caldicellulosiruptor morganii]WAM34251.1 nitrogenase [Caldicellulosiruptor morganii]